MEKHIHNINDEKIKEVEMLEDVAREISEM